MIMSPMSPLLALLLSVTAVAAAADANLWQPVYHCAGIPNDACYRWARLDADSEYPPTELSAGLERLFQALREEGYPLARLDSVASDDGSRRQLHFYIAASAPVVITEVNLIGYGTKSDSTKAGELNGRFKAVRWEKFGASLLHTQLESGFPYAQVSLLPGDIREEESQLQVSLNVGIRRGVFSRLSGVEFPGRRLTRERLLTLETRLKRGEAFREGGLQRAVERLKRLPIIADAGPVDVAEESPGWVRVGIPVVERRVNRASGIVAASGREAKPTGELRLEFGNLMGAGRQVRLEWLGLNPARAGVRAAYREPWLFGYPWHIGLQLEQWRLDTSVPAALQDLPERTTSVTTEYRLQAEWEPLDRLTASGALSRQSAALEIPTSELRNPQSTIWLEWGLGYDHRDREWNPAAGWQIQFSSARGFRQLPSSSSSSSTIIHRESMSAMGIAPISGKWLAVGSVGGRDIAGSSVRYDELTRLGGAGTVRGYVEDYALGRGAAWGSVELRWRPDAEGYLGLFIDAGRIYRTPHFLTDSPTHRLTDSPNLKSLGITAGITTAAGRLGLDLGIASGEPLRNARLHLRLEGWF